MKTLDEETDEIAQRAEDERAALMMARDHAIAMAGPEKKVVEFDHNGRRWITRWEKTPPPLGPFAADPWIMAWSYPFHKLTKRQLD